MAVPPAPGSSDSSHELDGLIVIMRPDPIATARALAQEHRVEVTMGGIATSRAVDQLLLNDQTGRPNSDDHETPPIPPTTLDPAPTRPPRRPSDLEIKAMANGMRRAEALRDRTRKRVADDLCQNLNSSLAIHPDTLKQAAGELTEAMEATTRARAGRSFGTMRARTAQAGSVGALGATATAIGLVVAWPAGIAVAGVGTVGGLTRWHSTRRRVREQLPELEEAEELARRRWERLAGLGADPTDLEAVIRRYDPQTDVVGNLLAHHPAVRAVQRVADDRRQAWVEAWQMAVDDPLLGVSPPSTHIDKPAVVLPGETVEADEHHPLPEPSPTEILVVVSPYEGLTKPDARALHNRLLALPGHIKVIVVLDNELLDGIDAVSDPSSTDHDRASSESAVDHQEPIIDLTQQSVAPPPPWLWSPTLADVVHRPSAGGR